MHVPLCQPPRSATGRFSVVALLAMGLCLIWARTVPADTATIIRGRSADSDCGPVPRVCVLPFFDSAAPQGFDPDLAALLEASLRRQSGLRVLSAWPDRRWIYEVEPWLIRGAWPRPEQGPETDIYFRLRLVWIERAASLGPSDFLVAGRIVRTGSLATLLADVLPASGSGRGEEVVLSLAEQAHAAEDIPAAIGKLAAGVGAALGRDQTRRCLRQAWARYRSGSWTLERAIQEAQARADEGPECLECRILLLGLLMEGGEPYAEQAETEARRIVAAWRDWTDETRRVAAENDLDPFVVLCGREAARADWSAVEATARLGLQTFSLNSRTYEKWLARSLIERGLWEEARQELERLVRHAPADPELEAWLSQAREGVREVSPPKERSEPGGAEALPETAPAARDSESDAK